MIGFDAIFHPNCMTFDYWIHTRVLQITVDLFLYPSEIPAINVKTNITRELVMQKNKTFVWTSQTPYLICRFIGLLFVVLFTTVQPRGFRLYNNTQPTKYFIPQSLWTYSVGNKSHAVSTDNQIDLISHECPMNSIFFYGSWNICH